MPLSPTRLFNWRHLAHPASVLILYSLLYTAFFSPVLLTGGLLAPGEGFLYHIPNFYAPRSLWEPMLWAGFPVPADPQAMVWNPVSAFFAYLTGSWNAFVISGYVLASCFAYAYVNLQTRSRLAAMIAGLTYGMSGFMLARVGQPSITQTAALLPLFLWALEELRRRVSVPLIALAGLAAGCSALAGHPQILVYTLGLGIAQATVLGWRGAPARWRYYSAVVLSIGLGVALAAIQILPAAELANLSLRREMSYEHFTGISLPPRQVLMLVFPYLFGGSPATIYGVPYFGGWGPFLGGWGPTEFAPYLGLLPLLLSFIAVVRWREQRMLAFFWAAVALLALLLAMGDATPLAGFLYHVPAYNKFRVPGRHLVETAFAVSVLAGLGAGAIQRAALAARSVRMILIAALALSVAAAGGLLLSARPIAAMAAERGIRMSIAVSLLNPAVGIPLVVFSLVLSALILWARKPVSKARQALLILVLIADLGSFGWFYEWRFTSPPKAFLSPTPAAVHYRDVLATSHQRILPVEGIAGSAAETALTTSRIASYSIAAESYLRRRDEIAPNLSRLWRVPAASGDTSLLLTRINELLSINENGSLGGPWASASNRGLDILAVRYVFVPRDDVSPAPVDQSRGACWAADNLQVSLGSGCGIQQPDSMRLGLTTAFHATALGLVSSLSCATDIADGSEVAKVVVTGAAGRTETLSLKAGRDTSEWSYDCEDTRATVRHSRAAVFSSATVPRKSGRCEAHAYKAVLQFERPTDVQSIEIRWTSAVGSIDLRSMSLLNDGTNRCLPLRGVNLLGDADRWRYVEDAGSASIFENLHASPRAWLVSQTIPLSAAEILGTLKTSRLPGGGVFDPLRVALVEDASAVGAARTGNIDSASEVTVHRIENGSLVVRTDSGEAAFLVLSDLEYPGWNARVDGIPVHLFQTDYVLRGVAVPAGRHVVEFGYYPRRLYLGAAVSLLAALTVIAIAGRWLLSLKNDQRP